MKDENKTAVLKKKIDCKFKKLAELQKEMLIPKKMIAGSLIKRYLGTKNHKRTSSAFYLSIRFKDGKRKLIYVSKSKVKLVRTQAMAWKKYKNDLKRWRELTDCINQDLKQLGELQDQLRQNSQ